MRTRSSPLTARNQIQTRPDIDDGIVAGLDALDTRDGIVDDGALLLVIVVGDGVQLEGAELDELALLRPAHGGVVGLIAVLGDLDPPGEGGAAVDDARLDLVVQKRRVAGLGVLVGQVRLTRVGRDAPAHVARLAVGAAGQLERVHAEVLLGGEARGRGFRRLHERQRRRVRAQVRFDRGWVFGGVGGGRGAERAQQLQEALARVHGEEGRRVRHDVGVLAPSILLRQHEPHGESARVGVGRVVRDLGQAGRVGEACDDGCRGRVEVVC